MPHYHVKALAQGGESYEAVMEATDKYTLYEELKNKGDSVLSVKEESEHAKVSIMSFLPLGFLNRIKTHEKILLARNLGSMIEAGLAVSRAINVLERQTKNKKMKEVLSTINKDISSGKTLNEALSAHPNIFPPLFVSMVKAGEESGSLADSLKTVALQMERSFELTRKIKGAMTYPSIIIFAMCGIAFFMMTYVIPQISSTFKEMNVPLPLTTRIVIGASDFMKVHWFLTLILILGFVLASFAGLRTKTGKRATDFTLLHLPVIGNLVKETNAARTSRTLSSLLTAGVDVIVATQITGEVLQNSYYKEVLAEVRKVVEKGEPISGVFSAHEKLYPPFVSEMMAVGEETGQMAHMLLGVAEFYEVEVEQRTKDMSTIIEPVLMIFIGLGVGFFAVSMIGPIYSIGNAIS